MICAVMGKNRKQRRRAENEARREGFTLSRRCRLSRALVVVLGAKRRQWAERPCSVMVSGRAMRSNVGAHRRAEAGEARCSTSGAAKG